MTGADRAALDWAINHGVPNGGWCPKGRLAEDGPINLRYRLEEKAMKRCPYCGKQYADDSDICPVDRQTLVEVETKRRMASAPVASGSAQNRHRTRSKPSVPLAISDPKPASRRRLASSSGPPRWLWLASVTPAYVRTSETCRP